MQIEMGDCRFTVAWEREEEIASETRQRNKREAEERRAGLRFDLG